MDLIQWVQLLFSSMSFMFLVEAADMTYWPLSVQRTSGSTSRRGKICTQVPVKHKRAGSNHHRVIAAVGAVGGRKTLEPIRKPGRKQEEIDPSEKPETFALGPLGERLSGEAVVKMAKTMLGS